MARKSRETLMQEHYDAVKELIAVERRLKALMKRIERKLKVICLDFNYSDKGGQQEEEM
jgi:hypothetical protein